MNRNFHWRVIAPLILLFAAGCQGTRGGGSTKVANSSGKGFALGVDVLKSNGFDALRGKRVGLVTNQTGVDGRGTKTRLVLHRAPEVNLVALYAPEHGIDGVIPAGEKLGNVRDRATGLTVYSLYGSTRKPTPAMLAGVDTLVFDMQDIGCRSYTYISTMVKCMEACGEQGKEFVVLDRPNPLGGNRIEGPPIEKQWISFVGQLPIPYVHGMTTGELAMMTNGRRWMAARCKLTVIPMRGWSRNMLWRDTGLRWFQTSPNIPHSNSPAYYVATGILGGLSNVDIGIGKAPFEYAGARSVNGNALVSYLRSLHTPGVTFTPYSRNGFSGARISINPRNNTDLTALDVRIIAKLSQLSNGRILNIPSSKATLFNKVYGSASLTRDLRRGVSVERIISGWKKYNDSFRSKRKPYLIYK